MRLASRTVVGACAFSLSANVAFASLVSVIWVGPEHGDWSVATNWLPQVVPQNGGGVEYAAVVDIYGNQTTVATVDQPFVSQQVVTLFGDTVLIKDGRSLRLTS